MFGLPAHTSSSLSRLTIPAPPALASTSTLQHNIISFRQHPTSLSSFSITAEKDLPDKPDLWTQLNKLKLAAGNSDVKESQYRAFFSQLPDNALQGYSWTEIGSLLESYGLRVCFPVMASALASVMIKPADKDQRLIEQSWAIFSQWPDSELVKSCDDRLWLLVSELTHLTPMQIRCGLLNMQQSLDVPLTKLEEMLDSTADAQCAEVKANSFRQNDARIDRSLPERDRMVALGFLSGYHRWTSDEMLVAARNACAEISLETVRQAYTVITTDIDKESQHWFNRNIKPVIKDISECDLIAAFSKEKMPETLQRSYLWLLFYYNNHFICKTSINDAYRVVNWQRSPAREEKIKQSFEQVKNSLKPELNPAGYFSEELMVIGALFLLKKDAEFKNKAIRLPELQIALHQYEIKKHALRNALAVVAIPEGELDNVAWVRPAWERLKAVSDQSLTIQISRLMAYWPQLEKVRPAKVVRVLYDQGIYISFQIEKDARIFLDKQQVKQKPNAAKTLRVR